MLTYDKNKLMKFLIFIEYCSKNNFSVRNALPLILPSEPGLPSSLHCYPISFVGTPPSFCRREKTGH